jgi:hypothetical protein
MQVKPICPDEPAGSSFKASTAEPSTSDPTQPPVSSSNSSETTKEPVEGLQNLLKKSDDAVEQIRPDDTMAVSEDVLPKPGEEISDSNREVPENSSSKKSMPSRCPECRKDVPSLQSHLHENFFSCTNTTIKSSKFLRRCDFCFMHLTTLCAYVAHNRIHRTTPPFICPECGATGFATRDIFMKHVKKVKW